MSHSYSAGQQSTLYHPSFQQMMNSSPLPPVVTAYSGPQHNMAYARGPMMDENAIMLQQQLLSMKAEVNRLESMMRVLFQGNPWKIHSKIQKSTKTPIETPKTSMVRKPAKSVSRSARNHPNKTKLNQKSLSYAAVLRGNKRPSNSGNGTLTLEKARTRERLKPASVATATSGHGVQNLNLNSTTAPTAFDSDKMPQRGSERPRARRKGSKRGGAGTQTQDRSRYPSRISREGTRTRSRDLSRDPFPREGTGTPSGYPPRGTLRRSTPNPRQSVRTVHKAQKSARHNLFLSILTQPQEGVVRRSTIRAAKDALVSAGVTDKTVQSVQVKKLGSKKPHIINVLASFHSEEEAASVLRCIILKNKQWRQEGSQQQKHQSERVVYAQADLPRHLRFSGVQGVSRFVAIEGPWHSIPAPSHGSSAAYKVKQVLRQAGLSELSASAVKTTAWIADEHKSDEHQVLLLCTRPAEVHRQLIARRQQIKTVSGFKIRGWHRMPRMPVQNQGQQRSIQNAEVTLHVEGSQGEELTTSAGDDQGEQPPDTSTPILVVEHESACTQQATKPPRSRVDARRASATAAANSLQRLGEVACVPARSRSVGVSRKTTAQTQTAASQPASIGMPTRVMTRQRSKEQSSNQRSD